MTDNISKDEFKNFRCDLFDPVSFLVDDADDFSPKDYASILYGIYGADPDLNTPLNKDELSSVYANIENMDPPEIADFLGYSFIDLYRKELY